MKAKHKHITAARGLIAPALIHGIARSLIDAIHVEGTVNENGRIIVANGPYIEGPVRQETGMQSNGTNAASYLMAMDNIAQPRPVFCPPNYAAGESRTAGAHIHPDGRLLNVYNGDGSLLIVPTLAEIIPDRLIEGKDYVTRPSQLEMLDGVTKECLLYIFPPNQHLIFSFSANTAHSFDGFSTEKDANVAIQSIHTNERRERKLLQKLNNGSGDFTDATIFISHPRQLTNKDIREYADILDMFQQSRSG